jgi:hypothetical protein
MERLRYLIFFLAEGISVAAGASEQFDKIVLLGNRICARTCIGGGRKVLAYVTLSREYYVSFLAIIMIDEA